MFKCNIAVTYLKQEKKRDGLRAGENIGEPNVMKSFAVALCARGIMTKFSLAQSAADIVTEKNIVLNAEADVLNCFKICWKAILPKRKEIC